MSACKSMQQLGGYAPLPPPPFFRLFCMSYSDRSDFEILTAGIVIADICLIIVQLLARSLDIADSVHIEVESIAYSKPSNKLELGTNSDMKLVNQGVFDSSFFRHTN